MGEIRRKYATLLKLKKGQKQGMKGMGVGGFGFPRTPLFVSNHKQGKDIVQNLLAVKMSEPSNVQV